MRAAQKKTIAFVMAESFGFAALAALDVMRPHASWFDRLNAWLISFAVARLLGVFAGAPVRRADGKAATVRGVLGLFPMALGGLVIGVSLLLSVLASTLEIFQPSWDFDLTLAAISAAMLPLFLLSEWLDSRRGKVEKV